MARSSHGGAYEMAAASPPRALQPLKPTVVTPTPASSTASTTALDSASSSSSSESDDDDERGDEHRGFLSRAPPPRRSHRAKSRTTSKRKSSRRSSREAQQQHKHRSRRSQHVEPYAFDGDLERGVADASATAGAVHAWQVMRELRAPCSTDGDGAVLQLVELKHANFGIRWRGADSEAPACMVGPHWWLMSSTFTVFLAAALVVTALTTPSAGFGEVITGVLLSSACLGMYAMVGCANPGIVERIEDPPDDTYSYCDHCDSYRPEGALHCMDCRVCIEGYDHHCPWTGKCVGRGNVRYFYAWLFFLVLAFVYEVIEFTTYILPPEDQPAGPTFLEDDDNSGGGGVGGAIRAAAARVVDAVGPH